MSHNDRTHAGSLVFFTDARRNICGDISGQQAKITGIFFLSWERNKSWWTTFYEEASQRARRWTYRESELPGCGSTFGNSFGGWNPAPAGTYTRWSKVIGNTGERLMFRLNGETKSNTESAVPIHSSYSATPPISRVHCLQPPTVVVDDGNWSVATVAERAY